MHLPLTNATEPIQLVSAIFSEDSSKIKILAGQGVNLNDSGVFDYPPLLRAVICGKSNSFQTLLACGADRGIKDKRGRSALDIAKQFNQTQMIQLLLKN